MGSLHLTGLNSIKKKSREKNQRKMSNTQQSEKLRHQIGRVMNFIQKLYPCGQTLRGQTLRSYCVTISALLNRRTRLARRPPRVSAVKIGRLNIWFCSLFVAVFHINLFCYLFLCLVRHADDVMEQRLTMGGRSTGRQIRLDVVRTHAPRKKQIARRHSLPHTCGPHVCGNHYFTCLRIDLQFVATFPSFYSFDVFGKKKQHRKIVLGSCQVE